MQRTKRSRYIAFLIGLVTATTLGVAAAAPAVAQVDPTVDAQLTQFLTTYGVDAATQADLIASFHAGEVWDSLSGADPVASTTTRLGGAQVTIERFADGSVSVLSLEQPRTSIRRNTVVPMAGVTGCTATYSADKRARTYTGCRAKLMAGTHTVAFSVDYRITVASDYVWVTSGRIDRAYDTYVGVVGGSASTPTLSITQATATASSPAKARMSTQITIAGIVSVTQWLQVNVKINSYSLAYTTSN